MTYTIDTLRGDNTWETIFNMADWVDPMNVTDEGSDPNGTPATADYNNPSYYDDAETMPWINATSVYIRRESYGTEGYRLFFSMDYSQEDLLGRLHLRYGVDTKDVKALFRVRLFGNGEVIDSDEFYVKIWGTGETYEACASASAVMRKQANDQTLAFAAGQKESKLVMNNVLIADITDLDDTTSTNCKVVYELQVMDPDTDSWISWDELGELLRTEYPTHEFRS